MEQGKNRCSSCANRSPIEPKTSVLYRRAILIHCALPLGSHTVFVRDAATGGFVPQSVNSHLQKCCAMREWRESPPHRNIRICACEEKSALRAHAAQNHNDRGGLEPNARRKNWNDPCLNQNGALSWLCSRKQKYFEQLGIGYREFVQLQVSELQIAACRCTAARRLRAQSGPCGYSAAATPISGPLNQSSWSWGTSERSSLVRW